MKKNVLITGGNGDIAKAIAEKLRKVGTYEIQMPGRSELDVTSVESVEHYISLYKVDILINNAGFILPQSIKNCNIADEKRTLDTNLFGVFNCTAGVLKQNPNAQIINIGSSAATKIHGTWSSYCASKAAVVMATKCWAEDGVNVVCISPGRTSTKMRTSLYPEEDKNTLLNPEDFAEIVLYAVQNKYKPGDHINVNLQNVGELINETKRSNNQN